jgi:hypothetical protein
MAFEKGHKLAPGGKRAGAGRKTTAATKLKRTLADQKIAEANYAFSLLCAYMRARPKRGEPESLARAEFRKACAVEVMDRVLGRSVQQVAQTGEVKVLVMGKSTWKP